MFEVLKKKVTVGTVITGLALASLFTTTAGAGVMAYQYKTQLVETKRELTITNNKLADSVAKVERQKTIIAGYQKCFNQLNDGSLIPEITQEGDTYVINYQCE